MANYDFTSCLSSLDFELLSKDLLEAETGRKLENFKEGRDQGIDLRYASASQSGENSDILEPSKLRPKSPEIIVQCKRYSKFENLKSELKNKELAKIIKLQPERYILTTSVSLSTMQTDAIEEILSPFIKSTGDIYGKDRLNSILTIHPEIERRHVKLWITSAGVLDSIANAGTHVVSREEVERTITAAKIYVKNNSFEEALSILKENRVCIISGQPGIGKTTLARMLLLYFYQQDFEVVKIESDISEARAVGYHKKRRFYYYDDFLGQTGQEDKLNKNEDQKLLDFIASVRDSKDSVFVLTTREYILNQAKLHYEKLDRENFNHRTCVIDLSKYTRRMRAEMLYNHLHFSKIPSSYVESLVTTRGYLKIVDHKNYNPRLIEYLTNMEWIGDTAPAGYLALFLRKLDNPVEIWEHAFRNQLSDKARHLLFVITTMPRENRIDDVKQAFLPFHNEQCSKYGYVHSARDFKNALKELDGTFISTRKIQDNVLISLQNPSIRDFMRQLLFNGEYFPEIIDTLVFFEQAQWLINTITENKKQETKSEIVRYYSRIIDALRRLFDATSCSIRIDGINSHQIIVPSVPNPVTRLATVAEAISNDEGKKDDGWIVTRIADLTSRVASGKLDLSLFTVSMHNFHNLGYLEMDVGKQLAMALKTASLIELSSIDDFECLATVVDLVPNVFTVIELEAVREAYSDFSDEYVADFDLSNPEDIREAAIRIGNIGNTLKVDTVRAERRLAETADEIEQQEPSNWDAQDDRRGLISDTDRCSDVELDSMFETLGETFE